VTWNALQAAIDAKVTALTAAISGLKSSSSSGGSTVSSQSVAKNKTVTQPTDPTYSGYTFTGWYTDAKLTEEYDSPRR